MDDAQPVPSKVLHLRNLPESVRENEVAGLALPFGRVANILLLRQKNQALLEMEDIATATALVNYYNQLPATLRSGCRDGTAIQLFFIIHKVLHVVQHCVYISVTCMHIPPRLGCQNVFLQPWNNVLKNKHVYIYVHACIYMYVC